MSSTASPEIKKEEAPAAAVAAEPNKTGDPVAPNAEPKATEEPPKASEEPKAPEEPPKASEEPKAPGETKAEPKATEEPKEEPKEETAASKNGLRRNINANIREKIKEADPVSETSIKRMLNIFGDLYDLNKTTDLKGTAQGLVSFVTNYGINPNYKMDIPLIIKAFYTVFPDGSDEPAKGFDEISKKPAYHLICNHIMYRMVTLKTEIQLQNRSSLRRGRLQDIYNKLDEFLEKGQCGRFSKAAAEDAFRREQANKLLKRDEATGGLVATAALEKKLQYIISILNQMIEDGMKNRLKQLQAQGFDCGPMESLLEQLESDKGTMPVGDMIKAYTDLKVSPGGLKICISRLRQQMAETNDLSKLILVLQSVKPGSTLTIELLMELIARLNKNCGKAAEGVAAELKKEIGVPEVPSPSPSPPSPSPPEPSAPPAEPEYDNIYYNSTGLEVVVDTKNEPILLPVSSTTLDSENFVISGSERFEVTDKKGQNGNVKKIGDRFIFSPIEVTATATVTPPVVEPVVKPEEKPVIPVVEPVKPEEKPVIPVVEPLVAPAKKLPTDQQVYYSDKTTKVLKNKTEGKDKSRKTIQVDVKIYPGPSITIDDEDFVKFAQQRYTITDSRDQRGFVKVIDEKYVFIPEEFLLTLKTVKPELVPEDEPINYQIETVLVGGQVPDTKGQYITYKGKNNIKGINQAVEGYDIFGNLLVSDEYDNTFVIDKLLDDQIGTFPLKDDNGLNTHIISDIYKDGISIGMPLTLLLQPINPKIASKLKHELFKAVIIPTFNAIVIDEKFPKLENPSTDLINEAHTYYLDQITNKEGLIEVHKELPKGTISNMLASLTYSLLGSHDINEQYALRLQETDNNNNSQTIPEFSEDKISYTIYFNTANPEMPENLKNKSFHMIIFIKNKIDFSNNPVMTKLRTENTEKIYQDGHFIHIIFGTDSDEPIKIPEAPSGDLPFKSQLVTAATLHLTSMPEKTPIQVITPNKDTPTGVLLSTGTSTEITGPEIVAAQDLLIYYKKPDGTYEPIIIIGKDKKGKEKSKILQVWENKYQIEADNSVKFIGKDGDRSPYQTEVIDGERYDIIYDKGKFVADGYNPEGSGPAASTGPVVVEPPPRTPTPPPPPPPPPPPRTPTPPPSPPKPAEPSPPPPSGTPTPPPPPPPPKSPTPPPPTVPDKSVTSTDIYKKDKSILQEIADNYSSTSRATNMNTRKIATKWQRLSEFFNNESTNKKYYYLAKYNKLITENMLNAIPDTNVKTYFKELMPGRIVAWQTLRGAIDNAKTTNPVDTDLINQFGAVMENKGELDKKNNELSSENPLDDDQKTQFSGILKYFTGIVPDSWLPATARGGNRLRRTNRTKVRGTNDNRLRRTRKNRSN